MGLDICWPLGSWPHRQTVKQGRNFLFQGEGVDQTMILSSPPVLDTTIYVGPSVDYLEIRDCTIVCGNRHAIFCGLPDTDTTKLKPLHLRLRNVRIETHRPGIWGIFSYRAFLDLENVEFRCPQLRQHTIYRHGSDLDGGSIVRDCTFFPTAGEHDKMRPDRREVPYTTGTFFYDRCEFRMAHQGVNNTDFGPAGIVHQGGGHNVVVDRCMFHGQENASRALMIDDGGETRSVPGNEGHPANGHVLVTRSGFFGRAKLDPINPQWTTHVPMVRCATDKFGWDGEWDVAKSFRLKHSALYGAYTMAEIQGVPQVQVDKCNTSRIFSIAGRRTDINLRETAISSENGWVELLSNGVRYGR